MDATTGIIYPCIKYLYEKSEKFEELLVTRSDRRLFIFFNCTIVVPDECFYRNGNYYCYFQMLKDKGRN